MYVEIQNKGITSEGNTGSCRDYVRYLQHENLWKEKNGMSLDIIPFFNMDKMAVSEDEVIKSIDSNVSYLHSKETKFFSCNISFSDKEVGFMGNTREDKIKSAHKYIVYCMSRYADSFGIWNLSSFFDLLYYYTIHEFTDKKDGQQRPGLHVHLIISRKDAYNKLKLSPMSNYKTDSSGKRGFDRNKFYQGCESIFDSMFGYKRSVQESYAYLNAIAHGSKTEKEEQVQRAVEEKQITENISDALSSRVDRLAKEALKQLAEIEARLNTELKTEDQVLRNKYWDEYFTYYKPQFLLLKKNSSDAIDLYFDIRKKFEKICDEITKPFQKLLTLDKKMKDFEEQIPKATTSKQIVTAISALIVLSNPIPALILSLGYALIFNARTQLAIETQRDLRRRTAAIYDDIRELKEQQKKLVDNKGNTLKAYLKVKNEKAKLQNILDLLKQELENTVEKKSSIIDLARRYDAYLKSEQESKTHDVRIDQCEKIYSFFSLANSVTRLKEVLSRDLLLVDEIAHLNGGIADFLITDRRTLKSFTLSEVVPKWKMITMLDNWDRLTGRKPAYKIEEQNNEISKISIKR